MITLFFKLFTGRSPKEKARVKASKDSRFKAETQGFETVPTRGPGSDMLIQTVTVGGIEYRILGLANLNVYSPKGNRVESFTVKLSLEDVTVGKAEAADSPVGESDDSPDARLSMAVAMAQQGNKAGARVILSTVKGFGPKKIEELLSSF